MTTDKYLTPNLTKEGLSMIVKALHGDSITFTKIVMGNGTPEDLDNVEDVANPLLNVPFVEKTAYADYLLLTGETTSASIEVSFYGKELGVYATDSSGQEYLYAYRYTENADFFPSSEEGRTLELRISVVVQVGTAENVTAILTEGEAYALKSDFNAHVTDQTNPHKVTKAQVGLSEVPNVATNDQTPTFTQATSRTNITSGEKLTTMLGKIAKLFADFATHLSASNPHNITPTKIGASASDHKHSTADITSGTLSVTRGGTGATSISEIKTALSMGNMYYKNLGNKACGNDGVTTFSSYLTLPAGKYIIIGTIFNYNYDYTAGIIDLTLTSQAYTNAMTVMPMGHPPSHETFIDAGSNSGTGNHREGTLVSLLSLTSQTDVYLGMHNLKGTGSKNFRGNLYAISIC